MSKCKWCTEDFPVHYKWLSYVLVWLSMVPSSSWVTEQVPQCNFKTGWKKQKNIKDTSHKESTLMSFGNAWHKEHSYHLQALSSCIDQRYHRRLKFVDRQT